MNNNIEKAFSNGYYGRKLRKEYKTRRDWKYYLKRGEKAFEKGLFEESYEYLSKSIEERMPTGSYLQMLSMIRHRQYLDSLVLDFMNFICEALFF